MAKPKTLLADVAAKLQARRTGYASWFDKLPDDAKAECFVVRDAFRRGELGLKSHAARALISAAKERGWPIAAEKQVSAWLAKNED
jgi:hypothetical protein